MVVVFYLVTNFLHIEKISSYKGELEGYPMISICVPARNEERGVEACLTSMLEQDYPNFEVIVVDDNSTDATHDILQRLSEKHSNLTIIQGEPLPSDWHGKPFALYQAQKIAKGEYILFADADPVFDHDLLKTSMHIMQDRNLDMFSLLPGSIFSSFWEKAAQPVFFGFIGSMTPFRKVNSPEFPEAMGVGAFTMVEKKLYDRMGGHESLKQEILDDIGLARVAKSFGARLLIADGQKLISIRMYHSLEEIRIGWRKNMFIAMRKSIPRAFYYIFILIALTISPYLLFIASWVNGEGFISQSISGINLFIILSVNFVFCKELRISTLYMFTFPLGALVFAGVMISSMSQAIFAGTTEWRGRKYAS
jgi:chlorobactene glucosyltransferase